MSPDVMECSPVISQTPFISRQTDHVRKIPQNRMNTF